MRRPVAISITVIIIILLILGIGIWWYASAQRAGAPAPVASQQTEMETRPADDTPNAPNEGVTIVFTDTGFAEDSYTVAAGQTVTVQNNSSNAVEFSSDDHPTHRINPELNMDVLQPGESQTFSPERTGTWGIHDHINAQYVTTLTVTK